MIAGNRRYLSLIHIYPQPHLAELRSGEHLLLLRTVQTVDANQVGARFAVMLVQQDKTLLDDLRCQLRARHTIPTTIADLALSLIHI